MTNLAQYLRNLEMLDLISVEKTNPQLTYAFKHIFTQETVYHSLLLSDRRSLHRQVGEALEHIYAETATHSDNQEHNEVALLLAHHFEQGQDDDRAVKYLKRAAIQAKAAYANQEAKSLFDRVLELVSETDFQTQWDILQEREQILDRLGQRQQQAEDLDHLEQLAKLINDELRLALTYNRQAVYLDKISDYQAAAEVAQQGLDLARRLRDERLQAQTLNLLALAAWRRFDYAQVKVYADQALDALHVTGDPVNRITSLLHLGKASYRLGQYDSALDYMEAARELAELTDNPDHEASCHLILGWIYQRLGDYEVAEQHFQATHNKRCLTGDRYGEAMALSHLGWVANDQQATEKGLDYCQQALELSQRIGDRENEAYSLTGLGLNHEQLGQRQLARAEYEQALAIHQQIGATTLAIFDQACLARLALKGNDLAAAREYIDPVTEWILAGKAQQFWDPWSIYLVAYQVLSALGDDETARQLLQEAYTVLHQRANEISDETLRHCFLEKVAINREINEAWQATSAL